MIGFSTDVTFDVIADAEARLPYPIPSSGDTSKTYTAAILLDSQADYNTLESYLSGFDLIPAMGGGGLVVVKWGRGTRTLTIPIANGGEVEYRALLIELRPRVRMLSDEYFAADVTFLVLGPPD